MRLSSVVGALAALTLVGAQAAPLAGQGFLDRVKQKAKQKVDQQSDRTAQAVVDGAEGSVRCAAGDRKCIEGAEKAGKVAVSESGDTLSSAAGGSTEVAAGAPAGAPAGGMPGKGAWANYDFKPGARILYADDFMADEVGDFPRRMEFKAGALEIVEWEGSRWLRVGDDNSRFIVVLPEALPERFTMEFDYTIPNGGEVWISFGNENKRIQIGGRGTASVYNQDTRIHANGEYAANGSPEKIRRARVLGDGRYIKVYLDDKRILNVPNADLGRSDSILFYTDSDTEKQTMFGNFRIAAGGKKLYDALAAEGRVATQGIYFDTGSDRIRGESSATLKEIGTMLTEHPDLKLTIEGHTDNVGAATANQALSQKRAEAVRQFLIANHGVDEGRLIAKGLGASKPAAPNTTPEGKQTNRRVELVRM